MVSSYALDAMMMDSVTCQHIWHQCSWSLSYLCCTDRTDGELVCFGDNFYGFLGRVICSTGDREEN